MLTPALAATLNAAKAAYRERFLDPSGVGLQLYLACLWFEERAKPGAREASAEEWQRAEADLHALMEVQK